jgi:hypothetical protein
LLAALQQRPSLLHKGLDQPEALAALLQPLRGGAQAIAEAMAAPLRSETPAESWRQAALKRALAQQCQAAAAIRWPDPQAALGGWPPPAALERQIRPEAWRAPLAGLITLQHLEAQSAP